MAEEQRNSEALPAGPSKIHREGKGLENSDGNEQQQQEDTEEIEERVTESPRAFESRRGASVNSDKSSTESNLETLASESRFVHNWSADFLGSSVTLNTGGNAESKETAGPPGKEIITTDSTQTENKLQVSVSPTSLSVLSPTIPKQKFSSPEVTNVHVPEADKKNSSGGKTLSTVSVARTPASDGYNWRKYGQKQVKSPTGSRSYYRCTHSDCCAKKIECCDHLGHVIDIVYKSGHSHDPPRKTNSSKEKCKLVSFNEPTVENSVPEQPIRDMKDCDLPLSSKEPPQEAPCSADKKQQSSSNKDDNGKVILMEEHVNEPEQKRRMKNDDFENLDSPVKPGKKPKLVVHAAGDVGISGDGYRWRKYGQKMVKGNPHPRNYYRCTSAGCPVRKHIETAVDNSNAVIITYKGVHDHDMPVPKKRHGPPSAPLMAAAAPASMNSLQLKKPDSPQKQKISTQWSLGSEGELTGEALDLGGEKAIESARTLLSIGFEIKPC